MAVRGIKLVRMLRVLMIADTAGMPVERGRLLRAAGYTGGGGYDVLRTLESEGIVRVSQGGYVRLTEEGRRFVRWLFRWDYLIVSRFPWILMVWAFLFLALAYLLVAPLLARRPMSVEEFAALCYVVLPGALRAVFLAVVALAALGIMFSYARYREIKRVEEVLRYS